MTPEQLKLSILQCAIQGKLVEQKIEEGSAKDLYCSIEKVKQKLIKDKKIKKEQGISEVREDEIPFDIPETWIWVRVGNIGVWRSGATPSRTVPEFYGGNIPWLKTGDLNDGYIDDVPEHITELAIIKTSVKLNPTGSILMAMYGATIGRLGIINKPMTTNQACCACIPFEGIYNLYVFYFLMAQRSSYIKMAEGGAQPNISKKKIINSLIPLPPYKEQKRIVNKKCGYYECKKCGNRFLSLQTMEKIPCPDCEAEIDYEIGPDESMEDILDTAQLLQKIEGEEEVEKMDALLSLAITGGDCNWI